MRTTITLDPDVDARVERVMKERRVSFGVAVNDLLRSALSTSSKSDPAYVTPTYAMGGFRIDVLQANRIVADFEDEAIVRTLRLATDR